MQHSRWYTMTVRLAVAVRPSSSVTLYRKLYTPGTQRPANVSASSVQATHASAPLLPHGVMDTTSIADDRSTCVALRPGAVGSDAPNATAPQLCAALADTHGPRYISGTVPYSTYTTLLLLLESELVEGSSCRVGPEVAGGRKTEAASQGVGMHT